MQTIRGTCLAVLSLIVILSAGKNAVAGCGKDTDCKGDRVCFEGQCVTPEGAAAAQKATVPATATSGLAPASPPSPTPGVAPAPPASGIAAPANYPQQPGGPSPQLSLAEIEFRQVVWTLKTPLRDEYEDYRTQGTVFVDGFAGFLLKKSKRMRTAGIAMLAVGLPTLIASAVAFVVGVRLLADDAGNGGQPRGAAAALTIAGGGVLIVSIPIVAIGGNWKNKGKKWKKSLEELLVYRQKVPLSSGVVQPIP